MNWFLLVGGVLLVAILLAVIYPLLKGQAGEAPEAAEQRALNLQILREQLHELERERAEGRIAEDAYRQAREEIERRTLADAAAPAPAAAAGGRKPWLAVAIAIAFPVVVGSLYWALGTPESVVPGKGAQSKEGEHALSPQQIAAMVERLALRLQENPNDGAGWLMLGRSYAVLGRYPESAAAFGRALSLLPPDAQHYADYADIVAMAQGKRLAGEPEKLVRRALEIDPNNLKALALAGTIAFEREDYQAAINEWQKVLALLPEGAGAAPGIMGSIRDAENRLASAGKPVTRPAAGEPAAAAGKISGVVELDPQLAASVKPDDTLFVYARAVNGPKMPVAMLRAKAGELPLRFTLDDSQAMAPQFKLSGAGQVIVGARISKSGDALPRAGDIEGLSAAVAPGADNLKIVIGSVVR